jgi:hypothetical protein
MFGRLMLLIYSWPRALSAHVVHRLPDDTSCNGTHSVPPADKITARYEPLLFRSSPDKTDRPMHYSHDRQES